jgi:hypothetical protein
MGFVIGFTLAAGGALMAIICTIADAPNTASKFQIVAWLGVIVALISGSMLISRLDE